jgi:hypothetical protein
MLSNMNRLSLIILDLSNVPRLALTFKRPSMNSTFPLIIFPCCENACLSFSARFLKRFVAFYLFCIQSVGNR